MSCVEMGGDVGGGGGGVGAVSCRFGGGLFSCRGEEREMGEERVNDQVIY